MLKDLDSNDLAGNFKDSHKKKLLEVSSKLTAVFNKQRQLLNEEADQRRKYTEAAVAAASMGTNVPIPPSDSSNNKAPLNLVEVMLHKKINSLVKQLETADQKSRYVTMQWQADKARFKETLDSKKAEMEDLMNRLVVMEVAI